MPDGIISCPNHIRIPLPTFLRRQRQSLVPSSHPILCRRPLPPPFAFTPLNLLPLPLPLPHCPSSLASFLLFLLSLPNPNPIIITPLPLPLPLHPHSHLLLPLPFPILVQQDKVFQDGLEALVPPRQQKHILGLDGGALGVARKGL